MTRAFPHLVVPLLALGLVVLGVFVAPGGASGAGTNAVPAASGQSSPSATPTRAAPTATATSRVATTTPTATMTPTRTPTLAAPTATATSRVATTTPTATRTPTRTPTRGPSPNGAPKFGIGIRYYGASTISSSWNHGAVTRDGSHGGSSSTLQKLIGNQREMNCGLADIGTRPDGCDAKIADGHSHGVPYVEFNDEGPPCAQLLLDEQAMAARAHAAGMLFNFAPVGGMLDKPNNCTTQQLTQMLNQADRISYQTQKDEAKQASSTYGAGVRSAVAHLHTLRPNIPISVQVSVNPPSNSSYTAAGVIADVDAIFAAGNPSTDWPDQIVIFYSGANEQKMLDVQRYYRP